MEAIISAEEFSKKYTRLRSSVALKDLTNFAVEFAKMHRKAILEEIAEDYLYYLEGDLISVGLNKLTFFKEVYPENNIK